MFSIFVLALPLSANRKRWRLSHWMEWPGQYWVRTCTHFLDKIHRDISFILIICFLTPTQRSWYQLLHWPHWIMLMDCCCIELWHKHCRFVSIQTFSWSSSGSTIMLGNSSIDLVLKHLCRCSRFDSSSNITPVGSLSKQHENAAATASSLHSPSYLPL